MFTPTGVQKLSHDERSVGGVDFAPEDRSSHPWSRPKVLFEGLDHGVGVPLDIQRVVVRTLGDWRHSPSTTSARGGLRVYEPGVRRNTCLSPEKGI
jgi:hypothetical protein